MRYVFPSLPDDVKVADEFEIPLIEINARYLDVRRYVDSVKMLARAEKLHWEYHRELDGSIVYTVC